MSTPQHHQFGLRDLQRGLNTRDRAEDIPTAAATQADNVWLYRGLEKAPGVKRVVSVRPQRSVPMLDGYRHFYRLKAASSSVWWLDPTAAPYSSTVGVLTLVCQTSSIRDQQVVLHRGDRETNVGSPTAATCFMLALEQGTNGLLDVVWYWASKATSTTRSVRVANVAEPGQNLHIAVKIDTSSHVVTVQVREVILADPTSPVVNLLGSADSGALGAGEEIPEQDEAEVTVGAAAALETSYILQAERQQHLQGKVQEVSFWNVDVTPFLNAGAFLQSPTGTAGLLTCYRMTEKATSVWPDNEGSDASLLLCPVDAVWADKVTPIGRKSLQFDGRTSRLVVRDAYRYRRPDVDTDGLLPAYEKEGGTWVGIVDELTADAYSLAHAAHTDDTAGSPFLPLGKNEADAGPVSVIANGSTVTTPTRRAWWQLQIVKQSGSYYFRTVWWWDNAGTLECFALAHPTVVSTGTPYHLAWSRNHTSGVMKLYVNGTEASSTQGTGSFPLRTSDNPGGSYRQYAIALGMAMKSVGKGNADPANPNDLDVRYVQIGLGGVSGQSAPFRGRVQSFALFANGEADAFLAKSIEERTWTFDLVRSMDLSVLSAWEFDEGDEGDVEDYGLLTNTLLFEDDPDHLRGHGMIVSQEKAPIYGVIDHRYTSLAGVKAERRRKLAVHEGGVDTIDEANNLLVPFAEGFRNDGDRRISTCRWQESTIIATGSGPIMQLWRDQLWRLGIKRPEGPFSWGLTNQDREKSALGKGRYIYYWVGYNARVGKESPPSNPIVIDLLGPGADVAFGEGIEAFQYPATTGVLDAFEPFDFENKKKQRVRFAVWLDGVQDPPSGGSSLPDAKWWKLHFTRNDGTPWGGYEDISSVKAVEVINKAAKQLPRVETLSTPEGRLEFRSRFIGSDARMRITEPSGVSPSPLTELGISGVAPINYSGGGTASDIPIPQPYDPQITHFRLYRTLADDSLPRLVMEIPAKTRTVVDRTKDEENVGEVLDLTAQGPPSRVSYIVDQFERVLAWGDERNPHFVYSSDEGLPWVWRTENVVAINDGSTMSLTMAARTEGLLMLAKRETLVVLTPASNPALPFNIDTFSRDVGSDSPFGAVNVDDRIFWPAERGFYAWSGGRPRLISRVIQPTWREVPSDLRDLISGVHYRAGECILWSAPSGDTKVNGLEVNDHALVWFYNVGGFGGDPYGWCRLTGIYWKDMFTIPSDDEIDELWMVDPFGFISKLDASSGNYADGGAAHLANLIFDHTFTAATAAASSTTTIALPTVSATKAPEKYLGMPVTIARTSDGTRETRLVVGVSDGSPYDALTLDRALSFSPSEDDQFILGSKETVWTTGDDTMMREPDTERTIFTYIDQTPSSPRGFYTVRWKGIGGVRVESWRSRTLYNDVAEHDFTMNARGRRLRLSVESKGRDVPFLIGSFMVMGSGPYKGARKA